MSVILRPSSAKNWYSCSHMAAHHAAYPPDTKYQHVGAVVGDRVHARITGHTYEEPQFIEFDEITRNQREIDREVDNIVEAVEKEMVKHKLVPEEKEISLETTIAVGQVEIKVQGALDAFCRSQEDQRFYIVDIKTGKVRPGKAFLQLALYAWLWEHCRSDKPAGFAGYLYVSRGKHNYPETVFRAVSDLLPIAEDAIRHRAMIEQYGTLRNPGMHCRQCPVRDGCAVREVDFEAKPRKVTGV